MSKQPVVSSKGASAPKDPPPPLRGETFAQLCARINANRRPIPTHLCPPLFGANAPSARQTIEITGEPNTGKTHLLMELMAHSVLARSHGGHEADVVLIDTEHHFDVFKLSAILEKYIRSSSSTAALADDDESIRRASEDCLQRVHLMSCHSPEQLKLAIYDLDRIIGANTQIGLLALDSVATYYWLNTPATSSAAATTDNRQQQPASDHQCPPPPIRMDTHVRRLVGQLQRIAAKSGILMVYVRPSGFRTKANPVQAAAVDSSRRGVTTGTFVADYSIQLESNDDGKLGKEDETSFCATVWDGQKVMVNRCSFTIDSFGIRWSTE